jgi:hypothetical protein
VTGTEMPSSPTRPRLQRTQHRQSVDAEMELIICITERHPVRCVR